MKLLVVGAAGRTGAAVVREALTAGHQVSAFVHRADRYNPPAGVTVHEGDATDGAATAAAVAGHDAVIDTIGGTTPYKSTVTVERDAATAIIAAMQQHGVRRLLVTSSIGVGDSIANGTVLLKVLVRTFLRGSTRDKAAMEHAVTSSGLEWTIARPAVLTDAPATGQVRVIDAATGEKVRKIARADIAAWLVEQLDSSAQLHRAVTVATS